MEDMVQSKFWPFELAYLLPSISDSLKLLLVQNLYIVYLEAFATLILLGSDHIGLLILNEMCR